LTPTGARPLLGVICCSRRVGAERVQSVVERYLRAAVLHAEADAVLIPALPDLQDAPRLLARLDGVLLTGSPSNVEPRRYGESAADAPGPFDSARDETALALIEAALLQDRPLLGICRGFQEVNVAFGGTLRRDLGEGRRALPHHAPEGAAFDEMFEHRHLVRLDPAGVLSRALGSGEIEVNSVHYQGIDRLGRELVPEAHAADGVVEAVRAPGSRLLAVQWHPEWRSAAAPHSAALFRLFGATLRGATLDQAATSISAGS